MSDQTAGIDDDVKHEHLLVLLGASAADAIALTHYHPIDTPGHSHEATVGSAETWVKVPV
jgi:hypothetical protein